MKELCELLLLVREVHMNDYFWPAQYISDKYPLADLGEGERGHSLLWPC